MRGPITMGFLAQFDLNLEWNPLKRTRGEEAPSVFGQCTYW